LQRIQQNIQQKFVKHTAKVYKTYNESLQNIQQKVNIQYKHTTNTYKTYNKSLQNIQPKHKNIQQKHSKYTTKAYKIGTFTV
jgi:glutamate mutase epsilon subunit